MSCEGRLPLRLTRKSGSAVLASETTSGDGSPTPPCTREIHPLLAHPSLGAIVPSASMNGARRRSPRGLLLPGPTAEPVEGVHQLLDIALGEAAAEVPCRGGRVGDAARPRGRRGRFVVPRRRSMFRRRPARRAARCAHAPADAVDLRGAASRRWRAPRSSVAGSGRSASAGRSTVRGCCRWRSRGLRSRFHNGMLVAAITPAYRLSAHSRCIWRSSADVAGGSCGCGGGPVGVAFAADLGDSGAVTENLCTRNSEDVYEPSIVPELPGVFGALSGPPTPKLYRSRLVKD